MKVSKQALQERLDVKTAALGKLQSEAQGLDSSLSTSQKEQNSQDTQISKLKDKLEKMRVSRQE